MCIRDRSCMANLLYPNLNWVIVYVKIWLFLQLQDNKTFYIAGNKVSGFEKVLNVCKFLLLLQKYEILYIYMTINNQVSFFIRTIKTWSLFVQSIIHCSYNTICWLESKILYTVCLNTSLHHDYKIYDGSKISHWVYTSLRAL